jgi:hypothetical protein
MISGHLSHTRYDLPACTVQPNCLCPVTKFVTADTPSHTIDFALSKAFLILLTTHNTLSNAPDNRSTIPFTLPITKSTTAFRQSLQNCKKLSMNCLILDNIVIHSVCRYVHNAQISIFIASTPSRNHCLIWSRLDITIVTNTAIKAISIVIGHHTAINASFTTHNAVLTAHIQATIDGIASHNHHKTVTNQAIHQANNIMLPSNSGFFSAQAVNLSINGITVSLRLFKAGAIA